MSQFTDDEILSYLIDDCSNEQKSKITLALKEDNEQLKQQVRQIELIREKILFAPVNSARPAQSHSFWGQVLQTGTFIVVSFFIGIYVEARYLVFDTKINSPAAMTMVKVIPKQLDWDEKNLAGLM
ncbi:MAG: hypothetical protein ISR65_12775 [Bacteriovoracaceae bacterium]|nr:hypothetical protein [Bacteriovoracaceae bacterium]